jgi:hypothetical protein
VGAHALRRRVARRRSPSGYPARHNRTTASRAGEARPTRSSSDRAAEGATAPDSLRHPYRARTGRSLGTGPRSRWRAGPVIVERASPKGKAPVRRRETLRSHDSGGSARASGARCRPLRPDEDP